MSSLPRFMFALLLSSAAVSTAQAATFVFGGTLSGDQEVGPTGSPGTGPVRITFDDVAQTMRVEATFSGLNGNTTAAHIHTAPPGANGGVATTVPSFPGFPLGVQAGSMDQTFNMMLASSYNPSFLNNATNMMSTAIASATLLGALRNNGAYFNIHTSAVGSGEIRANLTAIPEPATWALLIGGFGLVGSALRRRHAAPAPA